MRYELQLKMHHVIDPVQTRWDTVESFYDTDYGRERAQDMYRRISSSDPYRTYRLVEVHTEYRQILPELENLHA